MKKTPWVFSAAVFVAGLIMLVVYKQNVEAELSGGDRISVLAVTSAVSLGSPIRESDLGVQEIPEAYIEPRHILASDVKQVLGVRTANKLEVGESLLWSDLQVARNRRNLSMAIQYGKRAITIFGRDGDIHSLIRPGDRVDLLLTTNRDGSAVSFPLLQNLMVLAVGNDIGDRDEPGNNKINQGTFVRPSATISVTPAEAQLIAVAKTKGSLTPILRNPGDLAVSRRTGETTIDDVLESEKRALVQKNPFSMRGVNIEKVK